MPVTAEYDALASAYDDFTAGFPYERWLNGIEALAIGHGLRGRRVLDVACGTGNSFLPLLARGYEVVGCDASEAMLARAATKADGARLFQADMRELPDAGEFDLVTCLDDSLNYLLSETELVAALDGIRRALAPGGLAVWDVNTTAMYGGAFASTWVVETDERFIVWRGLVAGAFDPGACADAMIDVFEGAGECRRHARSLHRQRHWPAEAIGRCAGDAGLRILAVHGQHRGAVLEPELDEAIHTKALFVARREERG